MTRADNEESRNKRKGVASFDVCRRRDEYGLREIFRATALPKRKEITSR